MRNDAGKKVTLVWSEDDSPQTRDIENQNVANLTKRIVMQDDLLPLYEFQVHEFGTNRNLLINGQQIFTVTPSDDPESMTYIDITQTGMYVFLFRYTLYTIIFGAINFGENIFGEINFGKISAIYRISTEARPLKIFGVKNFRLGSSSPKLFHTEIHRK